MFTIEYFRGNEKFLPFDSAFLDDCLDGLPQRDLVVVKTSCIDMFAVAYLQSFSQHFCKELLILQSIGSQPDQGHDLLVG